MPISRSRPCAVAFGSAFHYAGRAIGLAAKYFRGNNDSRGRRVTVWNFFTTRRYRTRTSLRPKSLWIRRKREGNVTNSFNLKSMVDISHHLTIPVAPQWLLQKVLRQSIVTDGEQEKKTMQISKYLSSCGDKLSNCNWWSESFWMDWRQSHLHRPWNILLQRKLWTFGITWVCNLETIKNLCLMYMLVIMFWKGLVPIPRLGMTVHSLSLYHRWTDLSVTF